MDPKARLEKIQQRMDTSNAAVERTMGRLESARASLSSVREECKEKKIDPDKIDAVIEALSKRYETQASDLEADISKAEKELSPFLGETS